MPQILEDDRIGYQYLEYCLHTLVSQQAASQLERLQRADFEQFTTLLLRFALIFRQCHILAVSIVIY